MNAVDMETALGMFSTYESRTVDVGAGAQDGLLVVTAGIGGHNTGWLGVLLSIWPICERFVHPGMKTRFVGAADGFQDDWGWAGAMQSKAAAEYVYNRCYADFGDLSAIPRDLEKLFVEIDRVVRNAPNHDLINGLLASCVAATIEGTHVHGVHAGIGRALLLRAGTHQFESLVIAHYLHTMYAHRYEGVELPRNIVVNGLGCLASSSTGIDTFDVDLGPGDVLLILSRLTNVTEEGLARVVRESVEANVSIDELARAIERHAGETVNAPGDYSSRDFAFAIAWARPSTI